MSIEDTIKKHEETGNKKELENLREEGELTFDSHKVSLTEEAINRINALKEAEKTTSENIKLKDSERSRIEHLGGQDGVIKFEDRTKEFEAQVEEVMREAQSEIRKLAGEEKLESAEKPSENKTLQGEEKIKELNTILAEKNKPSYVETQKAIQGQQEKINITKGNIARLEKEIEQAKPFLKFSELEQERLAKEEGYKNALSKKTELEEKIKNAQARYSGFESKNVTLFRGQPKPPTDDMKAVVAEIEGYETEKKSFETTINVFSEIESKQEEMLDNARTAGIESNNLIYYKNQAKGKIEQDIMESQSHLKTLEQQLQNQNEEMVNIRKNL